MPEVREIPPQELETHAFQQAKNRIEKSQRIRADIKPLDGKPRNNQRVEEIRNLEKRSEQVEQGKISGLQELVMDSRGYQEKRFNMPYKSPTGDIISEQLVMFVKPDENGQPEWLTDDSGKPLALNGDLYESRLTSRKHAQGNDYNSFTIPRVDGRGAYTGVVTLFKSK
jgi:hypothetical protein